MCDPVLNSSHEALPFWCSLSLMTLPSEAPALLPQEKRTFPKLKKYFFVSVTIAIHSSTHQTHIRLTAYNKSTFEYRF